MFQVSCFRLHDMAEQEKREQFSHQDIRTMKKDITDLRETEAQEEREKIAALKPAKQELIQKKELNKLNKEASERERIKREIQRVEDKAKQVKQKWSPAPDSLRSSPPAGLPTEQRPLSRPEPTPLPPQLTPINPPTPDSPNTFEKIFLRIGLVLIIILIGVNLFLFIKWYSNEKAPVLVDLPIPAETPVPSPVQSPEELPATTTEPVVVPPEEAPTAIIAPQALITVNASTTKEISATHEILALISQELAKPTPENEFNQVLIKSSAENRFLGLSEFFQTFSIVPSQDFYTKLNNDFTLFVFGQTQGNRLGFVAKIIESGLSDTLASWEPAMETDFQNLFSLLGHTGPAYSSFFRNSSYKGAAVRYQTFSKQDLGICYAIINDYFVFSSSWQGLLRTIDNIVDNL